MGLPLLRGLFIWKYKGKSFRNKAVVKEGWSLSGGSFMGKYEGKGSLIWKYKGKGFGNKVVVKGGFIQGFIYGEYEGKKRDGPYP